MKRLAVITTHPIQYNAPLFKLLSQRGAIDILVFYSWGIQVLQDKYDHGFGKVINWDIPLLGGYNYRFLENTTKHPGSHHFFGIQNPDIIRDIKAYQPDAILVFGWSFHSHLQVLLHFHKKIPVFFRGDSTLLDESLNFSIKKVIRRFVLNWIYKHIDKALFVGTENKKYYLKHGVPDHKLVFAPHAVDNNFFEDKTDELQEKANKWREELGINKTDTVFLFAGKLEPTKNLQLLIDTYKGLKCKESKLLIIGNGILESELKAASKDDSRIIFLDFQNQSMMPLVYRLCDVFILPSKGETWGLAVNEAIACGRKVIVSNKCGCAIDLVSNACVGHIFKYNDKNELLGYMKDCITRRESNCSETDKNYKALLDIYNLDMLALAIESLLL